MAKLYPLITPSLSRAVMANLALQPKVNGLPPFGLHFILAQSRQPAAFG
jgi:hypothetical protein